MWRAACCSTMAEKRNGARYTSARRPVRLVYQAQFESRSAASIEESADQASVAQRKAAADRHGRRVNAHFDVIVIGAGAAGLMCALTAGQRGRKVLLLDHNDKVGAKILISGGGTLQFHQPALRAGGALSRPTRISTSPRSTATASMISSR